MGYHPTVTLPPLIGTTTGGQPTQQTYTTTGHYLQNLLENQTARNNTAPNPVQWSIASPISQHDRSIHADPSKRHRQQEQ